MRSQVAAFYARVSPHDLRRLRARMVTAMMSLETKKAVPMPHGLREAIKSYRRRTAAGAK